MSEATLGGWCHLDSPYVAEVFARAGFDWCCVDTQHGLCGRGALVSMVQAIAAGGSHSLVRVGMNRHDLIGAALDAGAAGVIVPQVSSVEQAVDAVRSCQYPPVGMRSWGPLRPKLRTPAPTPERANQNTECYPMIEDAAGLAAAAEIAAVPGITGLFVGPADLALDLYGDPTQANSPWTIDAAAKVAQACSATGVRAAVYAGPSAKGIASWLSAGFSMLAMDSDTNMLISTARRQLAEIRAELSGHDTKEFE